MICKWLIDPAATQLTWPRPPSDLWPRRRLPPKTAVAEEALQVVIQIVQSIDPFLMGGGHVKSPFVFLVI